MRIKSKQVAILLMLALSALVTGAYAQDPTPEEAKKRAREQTEEEDRKYKARIRQLLLDKGVPIDPDLLYRSDAREKLNSILADMPEMQVNYFRSEPLEGVIMGGEITLPDKVELVGDTIIFAKKLKFTSSNVLIKGPYHFYFYSIEPRSAIDGSQLRMSIDTSGRRGADGKSGASGQPGKDGEPGAPGKPGKKP
jgi:hypothetical protein